MGFIEETGAAQYYRDAKILTIYEGTTAIQANDLVGRKTQRDGGALARAIAQQIVGTEPRWPVATTRRRAMARRLRAAQAFEQVVAFVVEQSRTNPNAVYARLGAVPDARRQPGGRLADGARAGWFAQDRLAAGIDASSWRPRSRLRALLCRAHPWPACPGCATASSGWRESSSRARTF